MRYEVTIVATNTVLIEADNEDDATQQALALGVFETLDGADYDVTNVVPDPYNEKTMDKRVLFDGLRDLVKKSDVDFLEVYVGDEEEGQIYVRFDNLEEADDGN
jgi:hypothetical protein